jgi:hypothetical protein
MRYLVTARVKAGHDEALARAIRDGTLGAGSVAGGEYLRSMDRARLLPDGRVRWVEVCYCAEPLDEERPYWEAHFELLGVQDAHARRRCRHESGAETFACGGCDCTARLEERLSCTGERFREALVRRR